MHDMHYYIFRYKKSIIGKWLLGVCGGYEEGEFENCGHVFSEMQEYNENSAIEDATKMVEMIRKYYMDLAKKEMEKQGISDEDLQEGNINEDEKAKGGNFCGFVLLDSCECDLDLAMQYLKEDWGIEPDPKEKSEEERNENDEMRVFEVNGMLVAVSFMPAPVPNGEAEYFAAANYRWPEAVEGTKRHKAQIIVAIMPHGHSFIEVDKLYVKVCCSCLKLSNALGIYASGNVLQPEFYKDAAQIMEEDELPILNWIYIGMYNTENGMNGYTYDLNMFGKEEIEVIETNNAPDELYGFLFDISNYIISQDVTLRDGETIGFSAEQKLPITHSKGIAVEGNSLKIEF